MQSDYEPIFNPFNTLYILSRTARYLESGSLADVLPGDDVEKKVLKKLLRPIEENSLRFLSDVARKQVLRIEV